LVNITPHIYNQRKTGRCHPRFSSWNFIDTGNKSISYRLRNFNQSFVLINVRVCRGFLINLLKPTGHVTHQQFNIQQLYVLPTTVFMCLINIWEKTATYATYIINWLVFITEMKSVYCAVRIGSLNKAVCVSYDFETDVTAVPAVCIKHRMPDI
jgi:hypothetical protein